MVHNSDVFNFQEIVTGFREKIAEKNQNDKKEAHPLLDAITEETEFEDLSLYKEYLSGFDVERDLEGFELSYDPCYARYEADFPILLRLVAASFSSSYTLDYNTETGKVDLIITVQSGDQSITKKLDELRAFQILRLFEIYVEEQLNLAEIRENSESEKKAIDMQRNLRLVVYQKKLRMLRNKREGEKTLSSLDDLLDD